MNKCYALYLPLIFPEGLSVGAGSDYNVLKLALDGKSRPIFRGTSMAGVLRHAYEDIDNQNVELFFGMGEGDESYSRQPSDEKASRIEIPDCVLEFPGTKTNSNTRTHHLRNRHTGTVLDKGLFSIQACLPGTTSGCVIWLNPCDCTTEAAEDFLQTLVGMFDKVGGGLIVGGNSARGVGRAILKEDAKFQSFDLSDPQQYGRYLHARRELAGAESSDAISAIIKSDKDNWQTMKGKASRTDRLTIQLTLTIPRGQDILIADGQGSAAGMEPQRIQGADGKLYWRLPGSTLRGLFRSNITRLAARAGKTVADAAELYPQRSQITCQKDQAYTGANLAWAFVEQQKRKDNKVESVCPIINLFGSAFKRGRIHFSDSFCLCEPADEYNEKSDSQVEQFRMHLKIDPISGGNADGALFDNTVLTSAKQPKFDVVIQVDNPSKEECVWIVSTLRAINVGVLRIGSSKGSGRMALVGTPVVNGHNWKVDDDILDLFHARENYINNSPKETIIIKQDNIPDKKEKTAATVGSGEKYYIGYVIMNLSGRLPQKAVRYEKPKEKPSNDVPPAELKELKPNDKIRVYVDANNKFVRVTSDLVQSTQSTNATAQSNDNKHSNSKKKNQIKSDILKTPFFNPYTFIPFSDNPFRKDSPTQRSADEIEKERVSGYIDMTIETLRPLMTLFPKAVNATEKDNSPQKFRALTIGSDVIVPSTAIRGALRNLMMILTGGALGNLNPNAYACQGRDCQLGPVNPHFMDATIAESIPKTAFLAKVISPGSANRPGFIRVGKCKLVQREDLVRLYHSSEAELTRADESARKKKTHLFFSLHGNIPQKYNPQSGEQPWELKLSGKPINGKYKREGMYQEDPEAKNIEIPPELWVQYNFRNVAGVHPTLFKGDLIWLEHSDIKGKTITKTEEVKSLQWARWGRRGDRLIDLINPTLRPDTYRKDKKVDWVTDLFGQVSDTGDKNLPAFAGRIRPENLVFEDGKSKCYIGIELAPMSMPHPGCIGFYRDPNHEENGKLMLRGYKVYRNAQENEQPWKYSEQGIYGERGELKPFNDNPKMNRSADLLSEKTTGHLRIAFSALNEQELGILYQTCSTVWRLGGGKPLGLGLCQTKDVRVFILNDDGCVTEDLKREYKIDEAMKQRLIQQTKCWEATQKAVSKMRYPRAVSGNNFKLNRGGHAWFSQRSKSKTNSKKELQGLPVAEDLQKQLKTLPNSEIAGQWLPIFNPDNPSQDCLNGYDLYFQYISRSENGNKINACINFEPFDPSKHVTGNEHSEGNFSQNRQTREETKNERAKRAGEK